MFYIPRVNVIESDAGFSIEVLARTGMKYREGDKSLFIDSEVLAPGKGIAISVKSIKAWDPPHARELITEQEKAKIISNIKEAMEFRKAPLEVIY
jgi:hypothetical protein